MLHLRRVSSWQETRENIARARELAEKYGVNEVDPSDFIPQPEEQQREWDSLLRQIS